MRPSSPSEACPSGQAGVRWGLVLRARAGTFPPRTVAVVGHDRFFIDKIATRLPVVVGEGSVLDINGNWTTWQATTNRLRQCPFSKSLC